MSEAEGSGLESGKRPPGLRQRILKSIRPWGSPRHGTEGESRRSRRRSLDDSSTRQDNAAKDPSKVRRNKSFRVRTSRALHALVGRRRPSVDSSEARELENRSSSVVVSSQREPGAGPGAGEHPELSPVSSVTVSSEKSQTVPTLNVENVSQSSSRNQSITSNLSPCGSPLLRPRLSTKESTYSTFTKWLKGGRPGKDLCLWSPSTEADYEWVSMSGRTLTLVDEDCLLLSEAERRSLQKVALKQLAGYGVQVASIPKADSRVRGMRHAISLRSRGKLLGLEGDGGSPFENCTFNLPLVHVIRNDHDMIKKPAPPRSRPASVASSSDSLGESDQYSLNEGTVLDDNEDVPANATPTPLLRVDDMNDSRGSLDNISQPERNTSSLSVPYVDNDGDIGIVRSMSFSVTEDYLSVRPCHSGRSSPMPPMQIHSPDLMGSHDDIISRSDAGSAQTQLVEALSLPIAAGASPRRRPTVSSNKGDLQAEMNDLVAQPKRQVPVIVCEAINFLQKHGLHTVGLFRVAGAKKRWKKIQAEFDTGFEIQFDPQRHVASDVASLLKVFLRDLPEPLLTRDLFPAFMAAAKLEAEEAKLEVLRLLCCLLPLANRDTLYTLLTFLNEVARHSAELCALCNLPGNKMDCANLAVVIGPNILRAHKGKIGDEFKVPRQGEIEQQQDVKHIVALLIEHHRAVFTIPRSIQHEALLALKGKHPELLNCLLKQKCVDRGLETSLESNFPRRGSDCQSLDDLLLDALHRHRRAALAEPNGFQRLRSGTVTLGDLERHPVTGKFIPSYAVGGGALLARAASPRLWGAMPVKKMPQQSANTLLSMATEEASASFGDNPPPVFRRRLYSLPHILNECAVTSDSSSVIEDKPQTPTLVPESNGGDIPFSKRTPLANGQEQDKSMKQNSPALVHTPRKGDSASSSLRNSFRRLRRKLSLNASDRPNALTLQAGSSETPTGSGASTPKAVTLDSSSGDRTPQFDSRSSTGLTPVNSIRIVPYTHGVDKTLPELEQNIRAAMDAVRGIQNDQEAAATLKTPPFASTPKRRVIKQNSAPLLSPSGNYSDGRGQARRGSEIERLRQFFESLSNTASSELVSKVTHHQARGRGKRQLDNHTIPNGCKDSPESPVTPDSTSTGWLRTSLPGASESVV